jgi:predicted DNA-binding protein
MNKQTIDTHIYFPAKLHKAIKELARKERHTLSVEIVIAVEKHVENMKQRPKAC